MSRIAKAPIQVPKGVEIDIKSEEKILYYLPSLREASAAISARIFSSR